MRSRSITGVLVVGLLAWLLLAALPAAGADIRDRKADVDAKIDKLESKIEAAREREGALTAEIETVSAKIHALDPQRFDERFRRIWRVYLYGCAEMFRSRVGRTHLFQVVFSKGNVTTTSYPMSREFLYEQPASAEKRSTSRAA